MPPIDIPLYEVMFSRKPWVKTHLAIRLENGDSYKVTYDEARTWMRLLCWEESFAEHVLERTYAFHAVIVDVQAKRVITMPKQAVAEAMSKKD